MDNTEMLERSGKKLDHGYRTILETGTCLVNVFLIVIISLLFNIMSDKITCFYVCSEEIGSQVLQDLGSQRETIKRSRDRVSTYVPLNQAVIRASLAQQVKTIKSHVKYLVQLRNVNEDLGKSSRILSTMLRR